MPDHRSYLLIVTQPWGTVGICIKLLPKLQEENRVVSSNDTLAQYDFIYVKLSCAGYRVYLKHSQKNLTEAKTSLRTSPSVCKAQFFNLAFFSFYQKNTAMDHLETKSI